MKMLLKYLRARWIDLYVIASVIMGIITFVAGVVSGDLWIGIVGVIIGGSWLLGSFILSALIRINIDYKRWKDDEERKEK